MLNSGVTEAKVDQRLGKYRILRTISTQAMCIVVEALEDGFDQPIALKLLRSDRGLKPVVIKRFQRAAMTAASLCHEHIVPVYDIGRVDQTHFYAMKLIDGLNLRSIRKQLRLPESEREPAQASLLDQFQDPDFAIEVGRQVLSALSYSHDQGVIHRNIEPTNIIVDKLGKAWIGGFGSVKLVEGISETLSTSGNHFRGLRYASPEMLHNARMGETVEVDPRADIYSLAATMFEFFKGRLPSRNIERKANSNDTLTLPPALGKVLIKACAVEPEDRYQTASEFIEALARVGNGHVGFGSFAWLQNLCSRFSRS